jgi:putative aminopeptidase FrvX
MDLLRLLADLTGVAAPSGYEEAMIGRIREGFASAGLRPRVDSLGNVMAQVRPPAAGYPHVAVTAHMDEVGFVVRKIENSGFLRVQRVGGIPEKTMAGQRVLLLGERGIVHGVIATKAHHLTEDHEKYRVVPVSEIFVDIGASSAAAAVEAGIRVGTPAVWSPAFHVNGEVVHAKAVDDRVGCAILLAVAEAGAKVGGGAGCTLIASVQEEFNIRGILPAIRAIQPDVVLCLDIVPAADTPDTRHVGEVRLGGGPSVGVYSFHGRGTLNGLIPSPRLVRLVEDVARARDLPLQRHVFFGGLTEASYAQLEGWGIPSLDVGIPTRYTHSPVETCSLSDVRAGVSLVLSLLEALPADLDLSRG